MLTLFKGQNKQELFTMDCGGHLWGTELTCSNTCTAHEIRGLPTHPFFRCAIFHFRFILWEWLDRFVTIAIYTKLFFFNSLMQIDLFIFGGICRQHVISKRKERFCSKYYSTVSITQWTGKLQESRLINYAFYQKNLFIAHQN